MTSKSAPARTEAPTGAKVPVSMRALIARINRKLKPDTEALKAARSARARQDFGDFYVIDHKRNWLVARNVDPEAYGRELGVLHDYEVVEEG